MQTRTQIAALQRRLGTTTVYVTHDQVEAMTMGDRVAVLRFGKLQQFAAPNELYDRPANAFVAGFIGSPAMNLVTLPVTADGVKIGDSTLELERDNLTKLSDAGLSEVTFGIRPEQLELTDSGGVEVVVDLVEDLGSEAYVYTHAGSGVELVARCNPRKAPKLADTVRLAPPSRWRGPPVPSRDRRAHQLAMRAPEFRLRTPTPGLLGLPWDRPLSEWMVPDVPLRDIAVGPSRHLVKFVEADDLLWAVKDMPPRIAAKEYDVLRGSRTWACPRCVRQAWCCSRSSTPRSWSPATSRGPGSTAACSCGCRRTSRSTGRASWTRWPACWWNCIATASSGVTARWRTRCSPATASYCRHGWSTPRPPRFTRR